MDLAPKLYPQLDRVTVRYLEALAREHSAAYPGTKAPDAELIAWAERGETLIEAVEAWRKLAGPDIVANTIRRGLAR